MFPAIALLLSAQGQTNPPLLDPGQDPPRLRTLLPSGAVLLVEPAPKSKNLIVHLFASSRGVDESKTSGLRHLLEHLCVKGMDGALDDRLEAQAAFLTAHVMRDALDVEIEAAPDKLGLALDGIKDVLAAHGWDANAIAHEAGIIEQEIDLRDDAAKLAAALWAEAYGGNGADPLGDLDTIKAATPEALEAVRKATFATENLVLVIEGPVSLKEGRRLGSEFLRTLPGRAGAPTRLSCGPSTWPVRAPALLVDSLARRAGAPAVLVDPLARRVGAPALLVDALARRAGEPALPVDPLARRVGAPALQGDRIPKSGPARADVDAFGEANGVAVPPISDPKCVAAICAALAIASELRDAFVTYTPSALHGMVIVGQTNEIGKVGTTIDNINAEGADGLFERGRTLGMRWAARQVATPEASAYTRGLLICRDVELRFDAVQKQMAHVSLVDFREAMARLGTAHAFVAVGKL